MLTVANAVALLRSKNQIGGPGPVSVKQLLATHQPTPRNSVKALLRHIFQNIGGQTQPDDDTIVLKHNIVTNVALGGWVEVTIKRDGNIRFRGHMHGSGFQGYNFRVRTSVLGAPIGLTHEQSGYVRGTPEFDYERNYDWDAPDFKPLGDRGFRALQASWIRVDEWHEGSIGALLEEVGSAFTKWFVGEIAFNPVTAAMLFVGAQMATLFAQGSALPGARLISGVLWLAGPSGTAFALLGEGVIHLGSNERLLSEDEYGYVREVFHDTLPQREDIILTDIIAGTRAFVFFRFDGKHTLNMGPEGFADPINYQLHVKAPGEVFVHEMVHVWQIFQSTFDVSWTLDVICTQVENIAPGSAYKYGNAGPAFHDFNPEQQASIVGDWFVGRDRVEGSLGLTPKDPASPYFRYIANNIQLGAP